MKILISVVIIALLSSCQSTSEPKYDACLDAQGQAKPPRLEWKGRKVISVKPTRKKSNAQSEVEGWVKLNLTIGRNGAVKNVEVIDSMPKGVFVEDAIWAGKKGKYLPACIKYEHEEMFEFKASKSSK